MVKIVAHNYAKPENVDKVVGLLRELAKGSRAENGCIRYDIFVDREDPCHLVIVEEWESPEVLPAHRESEHYTRIIPQMRELMAKPGLVARMDPVDMV